MKVAGFLLALMLPGAMAGAQDYLNCHFLPGWEQSGPKRQFIAENLFEYKDGAAEGYLVYGFVRMQGITCKLGQDSLDIDVSEMTDEDLAYGILTANVDPGFPVVQIGMGGQVLRQSASFAKGKYYVEITEVAANPLSDQTAMLRAFADRMIAHLEGRSSAPAVMGWFPRENLVSTKLVPESVLGLRQLRRGFVAKYKQGQAFIVLEDSPESAAAVLKSLRTRFSGATAAKVGDEGFQATAEYLAGLCIFRKGRILAGYANLSDAADAVTLAAKLASSLP